MTPTLLPTDLLPPPVADGVHSPVTEPDLPDDGLPPLSEDMRTALRELDWLDGELNAGRLDRYSGEYLISLDHTILAHNVLLWTAWDEAVSITAGRGVPPERLTIYNVPSGDDYLEVP